MGPGGFTIVLVPGKRLGFLQAPGKTTTCQRCSRSRIRQDPTILARSESEERRTAPPDLSLVTKPIDLRHSIAVRIAL